MYLFYPQNFVAPNNKYFNTYNFRKTGLQFEWKGPFKKLLITHIGYANVENTKVLQNVVGNYEPSMWENTARAISSANLTREKYYWNAYKFLYCQGLKAGEKL